MQPANTAVASAAVEHLRALIRFETVNPPGNERPAAEYVADVGRRAGLDAAVLDSGPGRGNAVLRLPGRGAAVLRLPGRGAAGSIKAGAAGPIVLLSHLDTVPVEADRWTHPPFDAVVADGCVWGRGAIDSKLTTAVQLAALIDLAASGVPPRRDIVLAATASEEMGGPENGAAWLAEHRPDLLAADLILSEHGGFVVEVGGRRYYTIQTAEKGGCSADLVARGAPGHASVPRDDNAIHRLARALDRLDRNPMPIHITATLRAFAEAIAADHAAHGSTEVAALVRGLTSPDTAAEALARLPVTPGTRRTLDALLRNTAAPTIIEAGTKRNVIPSRAIARLSGRPLPDIDLAAFLAELRAAVGPEVEVVGADFVPAIERRLDPAFERAARRALRRHDPDAVVVPFMMPLGTDAKRLTSLPSPIYGFVPMLHEPELDYMSLCHGHDERASLASIAFGANVMRDLLADLAFDSGPVDVDDVPGRGAPAR